MHDDDRDLLGPTEGDPPSPEFVEDLWARLDDAWESRDEPTSAGPSPTAIDVAVHDDKDRPMGKQQLWTILGAVAAIVIVVGGIVVISNRDDDEPAVTDAPAAPTPTNDTVPRTEPLESAPAPATAPPTTEPAPPPTDPPVGGGFDITYIEVDAAGAVAANDEFAWVVGDDTGLLSTIDLATNTVVSTAEVPAGSNGAWYAFESVWIGLDDDQAVARFDPVDGAIVATIEVGGAPTWLEAGDDAVWLGTFSGEAVRIDPATNTVVATIPVGDPFAVISGTSISADGVWMRDLRGRVFHIDPATDTVVATIDTPSANAAMAAGPDALWAPGSRSGVLYRIDPATESVVAEVDVNAAVGTDVTLFGLYFAGDSVWQRFRCARADLAGCPQGIAQIDPSTNEVVAVENLREGWGESGMSAGPTTVWTGSGDVIARIDP